MNSNEIATTEEARTRLEVFPPAPLSQQSRTSVARQVLRDHAELSEMAWQFATKLVGTRMVPLRFRNQAEEATAAILYGAELGLGPIASLQNIFDVHGSPGIYARTAQALLEAKGFRFRTITDTNQVAVVAGMRPETVAPWDMADEESTFTYEDAELAGWAPQLEESVKGGRMIRGVRYQVNTNGKLIGNEKYLTQPRQMLWAKAMMEVCRRLSPATLLGIAYSVEELESEHGSEAPTGGGKAPATQMAPLTVDEIMAAAPPMDPAKSVVVDGRAKPAEQAPAQAAVVVDTLEPLDVEPTVEPEPVAEPVAAPPAAASPDKRATKKQIAADRAAAVKAAKAAANLVDPAEQPVVGVQVEGEIKGYTDRVEAALKQANAVVGASGGVDGETAAPSQAAPVTTPASQPTDADEDGPSDDPSMEPPVVDEDAAMDAAMDAAFDQAQAGAADIGVDAKLPATRDQLQDLAKCIAAAGFQPSNEGREQWFAWLSQEVGTDVTANNQLTRGEIVSVIAAMETDQV